MLRDMWRARASLIISFTLAVFEDLRGADSYVRKVQVRRVRSRRSGIGWQGIAFHWRSLHTTFD